MISLLLCKLQSLLQIFKDIYRYSDYFVFLKGICLLVEQKSWLDLYFQDSTNNLRFIRFCYKLFILKYHRIFRACITYATEVEMDFLEKSFMEISWNPFPLVLPNLVFVMLYLCYYYKVFVSLGNGLIVSTIVPDQFIIL